MDEEITVTDLMQIISGVDESNHPIATAMLGELKLKEGASKPIISKEIDLAGGIINGVSYGGCAVITIDLPPESQTEFNFSSKYLKRYLGYIADEDQGRDIPQKEEDKLISLVIVPILLEGQGYMVLNSLVFCDSYIKKGGVGRIIMGFDVATEGSIMMYGADMDFNAIRNDVDNELESELEALDDEIATLMEQKDEIEHSNEYQNNIVEKLNEGINMDRLYGKKDEDGYRSIGGFRFRDDENNNQE